MATSARLDAALVIAGKRLTHTISVSDESAEVQDITLAAAIAGTLTTRTDDNTGILTVPTGHGITASDTVSVFWEGTNNHRYGVDVTAVTSTTISIDLGSGTNLPVATTAMTLSKEISSALILVGSDLQAWGITSQNRLLVQFMDGASGVLALALAAKEGFVWISNLHLGNLLDTLDVTSVKLSNADASEVTVGLAFLKTTV